MEMDNNTAQSFLWLEFLYFLLYTWMPGGGMLGKVQVLISSLTTSTEVSVPWPPATSIAGKYLSAFN